MNWDYVLVFTLILGFIFFVIQRAEPRYRRTVAILLLLTGGFLLRNLAVNRGVESEAWLALFLALLFNFLFWALIGRYNPVKSSDDIQVLGMDD